MEVADIGRNVGDSQIVHAFVETNMEANLHAIGFGIAPQNVLGGVREEPKKDAAFGVILQATVSLTGGSHPCATTKSSEVSEIGHLTGVETFTVGRTVNQGKHSGYEESKRTHAARTEDQDSQQSRGCAKHRR